MKAPMTMAKVFAALTSLTMFMENLLPRPSVFELAVCGCSDATARAWFIATRKTSPYMTRTMRRGRKKSIAVTTV